MAQPALGGAGAQGVETPRSPAIGMAIGSAWHSTAAGAASRHAGLRRSFAGQIVCHLLLRRAHLEESEPVTILYDAKWVIGDHRVDKLFPDELLAYLRTPPRGR